MKYLLIIISTIILSSCTLGNNQSIDNNKKLCQQYSSNYNISVCDNNFAKIWPKNQTPGTGSTIINLTDFSETKCPVVAPNLLDKKCLANLKCSPITCN